MTARRVTAALALAVMVLAADADAAPKSHDEAVRQHIAEGLAEHADRRERDLHKLVEDGLRRGGWPVPAGSRTAYLSLREAALRALQHGLPARISRMSPDIAEAALQEARAVFDPVFSFSIAYNQTNTYRRAMEAMVQRKSFTPGAPTGYVCVETGVSPSLGSGKCPKDETRASPAVIALGYLIQYSGTEIREIEASSDSLNNTDINHSFTYTVTLSQRLPWGPEVSLTHETYQKRIYYREGKYWADADVTANLTLSLATPLPYTKGFGPDSPQDALVRQERIARGAADWLVQDTLNGILLEVDGAWWTLVARLEDLQVYRQILQRVEQRAARLERLYARGLATQLERNQVLAEQSRVRGQWDEARRAFLAASTTLGALIEPDPQVLQRRVWLPYGYTPLLAEWPQPNFDQAWQVAQDSRPDLHVEIARRQIADIDVDVARNQTRPDLSLQVTGALRQSHEVFGYADAFAATEALADPDQIYLTGTLGYTYQIGNRAARARLAQKRILLTDQQHSVQSTEDLARRELQDAIDLLTAAREAAAFRQAEVADLTEALRRLEHVRETTGGVSESEIIQVVRRLQVALLSHVAAVTEAKMAEGQLLAAQGLLPARFGERSTAEPFERDRLSRLVKAGVLTRFAAPSSESQP